MGQTSPGVPGTPGIGDQSGATLAASDFTATSEGTPLDDLAVGIPGETDGRRQLANVNVLRGTTNGLSADGLIILRQDKPTAPVPDPVRESRNNFGRSLAAVNFSGPSNDAADDLVVSNDQFIETNARSCLGFINVYYGIRSGLDPNRRQIICAHHVEHAEREELYLGEVLAGR